MRKSKSGPEELAALARAAAMAGISEEHLASLLRALRLPVPPIGLSMKQAAAFSGLSRAELYEMKREGLLPVHKRGNRSVVLWEDLWAALHALPLAGD